MPAINIALDWRVIAFGVVAAVAASVMFGLAPGIHILKLAIADGLKGRPPVLRGRRFRANTREILIVVQVAASVALLLAAGLFADAFTRGNTASDTFNVTVVDTTAPALTLPGNLTPEATSALGAPVMSA